MGARIRRRLAGHADLAPIWAILVVVVAANALLQEQRMFTLTNLTLLLVQLAPYVLAAMAQTLVMLLGGIDLSVGALISLASALVATNLTHGGANLLVVAVVVAVTAVLGALTGVLIARLRLHPIVVTLGTSFVWGGLALQVLPTPGGSVPESVALWFTGVLGGVPLPAVLLAVCFAVWGHLRRTRVGLRLYAVGDDVNAARATGLRVTATHAAAFGLAGGFAGLAGVMLSAQTLSGDAGIGTSFTLSSIAAAVLGSVSFFGGQGKMTGSVAGGLVVGMLVTLMLNAGISSFYQGVAEGVLLIAVVAVAAWRQGTGVADLRRLLRAGPPTPATGGDQR